MRGEDIFWAVGRACAKEGRPQFILEALAEALAIVDAGDREWIQVWLPYMAGRFKYTLRPRGAGCAGDVPEAVSAKE